VTGSTYVNATLTGRVFRNFALGLSKRINCLLTISIQRTSGVTEFH